MAWVSESHSQAYQALIQRAVDDPKVFNVFKCMTPFPAVVGISEPAHCIKCFSKIVTIPAVHKNLEAFKVNDRIGTPPFKVGVNKGAFQLGHDTIRFAESVALIYEAFGDLSGKVITEFGSNYGGLATVLLTQFPAVKSYSLIDLPVVQALSMKYLSALGIGTGIVSTAEPSGPVDLFISEYGLTEFGDVDIFDHYDRFCKPAKALFLRCNIPDTGREKEFLDTVAMDFDLTVTPEPSFRRPNKVITGTRKTANH